MKKLHRLMTKYKAVGATMPIVSETPGYYDNRGRWVPAQVIEETAPIDCAFLPLGRNIMRDFPGQYSSHDRKVFTRQPLPVGTKITYNNTTYTVESETDYSLYSGFFVYIVKASELHAST